MPEKVKTKLGLVIIAIRGDDSYLATVEDFKDNLPIEAVAVVYSHSRLDILGVPMPAHSILARGYWEPLPDIVPEEVASGLDAAFNRHKGDFEPQIKDWKVQLARTAERFKEADDA